MPFDRVGPTRAAALRAATKKLVADGIPDALIDARLLLCAAAGIDRAGLVRDPDLPLGAEPAALFETYLRRRAAREPVSRILGRREFWGLDLMVTPAVLDPRPDTETLVSAVLEIVGRDRGHPWRILDLGTGSGAILCALLSELPAARGWAVDRSFAACGVARHNLLRHGLAGRGLVLQGDWAASLPPQSFDFAVSNPPYIETAVIAGLDRSVRDHDPHAALDGGADGLAAYRAIVQQLPTLLAPAGHALFEVGAGQAGDVAELLQHATLTRLRTHRDLAGVERVVAAHREPVPIIDPTSLDQGPRPRDE